ncbi:M15 family metallopeptidase [Microbispora sp. NEAU-D428]|uniref:M15 family metallopeptidase n=1 Tax=Microbispora sitophila TaxID=2771537 RepID=UPI0018666A41|nr:M15 family metallopeptidase [Microbispora sitophila]MBE3012714.1 M15 family metallopeptidase [Microbispora sitophila]
MSRIPASTRKAFRKNYWILGVGLIFVIAMIGAALGCQSQNSSPSSAASWSSPTASPSHVPRSAHRGSPGEKGPRGEQRGPLGEADGVVPDGVTVFDDAIPAVANLDPDLLTALRRAATDAANDRIEFYVNSGWRSPAYQNQLLREAVSKYGSEKEAARWVATADTSLHVKGEAVDIGHSDATVWLSKHGAEYGLCQIYRNETWHYELRPEAIDHGCPRMYADPTQDPRMRK